MTTTYSADGRVFDTHEELQAYLAEQASLKPLPEDALLTVTDIRDTTKLRSTP